MVTFGPAGNSESFYSEGGRHTWQAMAWVAEKGLGAFEYSCGKGVKMSGETAAILRGEAERHGISLSLHAPYYTNLANPDPAMRQKTNQYILQTLELCQKLGGKRVIFHPGSYMQQPPLQALTMAKEQLAVLLAEMEAAGYSSLTLCPETLGKQAQLGGVEEIIELCRLDERLYPCVDFGHLYARSLGTFGSREDYSQVLRQIANGLGEERARGLHIHFSRIEFTKGGEKMHRTYAETEWGPDFTPLCEVLCETGSNATVICESNGTMAEDSVLFQAMYQNCLNNNQHFKMSGR